MGKKNKQGKCCLKKQSMKYNIPPSLKNKSSVYFFYAQKGKHWLKHAGFQTALPT